MNGKLDGFSTIPQPTLNVELPERRQTPEEQAGNSDDTLVKLSLAPQESPTGTTPRVSQE
jgi:hypothetical protein